VAIKRPALRPQNPGTNLSPKIAELENGFTASGLLLVESTFSITLLPRSTSAVNPWENTYKPPSRILPLSNRFQQSRTAGTRSNGISIQAFPAAAGFAPE